MIHFQNVRRITLIQFENGRKYHFDPVSTNFSKLVQSDIFDRFQIGSLSILKVNQTDYRIKFTEVDQKAKILESRTDPGLVP